MANETEVVKAVCILNRRIYRTLLYPNQYQRLNSWQIQLPPNYYSRGYYERMSDKSWDDLEWMP